MMVYLVMTVMGWLALAVIGAWAAVLWAKRDEVPRSRKRGLTPISAPPRLTLVGTPPRLEMGVRRDRKMPGEG